ncbi:hypothetical protein GGI07_003078 [Coemansia sp. Benny D115]|nr:hypothetical protein GGI07_003078 [Coemansia sp. Benny D115]
MLRSGFRIANVAAHSRSFVCRHLARRSFTIAIDGPAASGKSSTARAVAQELGFGYIDSGSIYRCATLLAQRNAFADLDSKQVDELALLMDQASVDIRVRPANNCQNQSLGRLAVPEVQIILNGEDVSDDIRTPEVNRMVAKVAGESKIRNTVLHIQRRLAKNAETKPTSGSVDGSEALPGGVVMDGRDIGTTIFPSAELKIYLDASAMARAIRRWDEMNNRMKALSAKKNAESETASATAGSQETVSYPSVEEIARELEARDYADINRQHSPLRIASDAVVIDNTNLTFEQQVYNIADLARERMGLKPKHADI